MINEKIKLLRKQNNMTQEELADKMNVSRQAVTKWESGAGTPDVGNLEGLAKIFSISVDQILSDEITDKNDNVSRTEFDIFAKDDFEFDFGNANRLDLTLGEQEKVLIEIRTDLNDPAYKIAKVKLENGRKIDLTVIQIKTDKKYLSVDTNKSLSDQDAKNHIFIKITLPSKLSRKIELNGNVKTLSIRDFNCEKHVEFDGKADCVDLKNLKGRLELNTSVDTKINYDGSLDQLDVNQLNSVSNLFVCDGAKLNVYNKSRSCKIVFDGFENDPTAKNQVELNGRKSELTVKRA